ncbi:nudix hydrolase 2-like isoform X2 [Andrographis paniculata]|uniref:nudix hydrolase 2-like isoform X2 n=1 Tax=Andrographis paniculata TaxID=175694 RepID=UPI0021E75AC4|nr:nudix hydrolase 2-like isoform X2 [Andrographis paniculata]XP_051135550.1 nudix hydrolase 2-like isoform X2 [Andrographis paniculata]
MTFVRFICRPSAVCYATCRVVPFPSFSRRAFSTSSSSISFQGRLGKRRFGIYQSIRSSMSSSSPSSVLSEKQTPHVGRILEGKNDDHGGVIVEMACEPMDSIAFASILKASLSHWQQQGKRGIWIKIPIELVNLVEPAVKEGFYFHHAEPKYLMLVHWLPDTANTLPANASHRVGVAAFVLNEKNEVLVVQENSGIFRGKDAWKFPTGVVDEGEDICNAAVREVKEETGVDSKFLEVLAFRQSHKAYFEKSDLFFVCMLQPLSSELQPQAAEIEAAQWMPFEEYLAQPSVHKHELIKKIAEICQAKIRGTYTGFSPIPTPTPFTDRTAYLYVNGPGLDII